MPPKRNATRARREFNEDHKAALVFGIDFFGGAWNDPHRLEKAGRHDEAAAWPSEDVLREMELCWSQHGDYLRTTYGHVSPLFGELVFERGVAPLDALKHSRN